MKHYALKSLWGLVMPCYCSQDAIFLIKSTTSPSKLRSTIRLRSRKISIRTESPCPTRMLERSTQPRMPTLTKYKDKIKEFTVHSVEYTVTDYAAEGEVIFSNGMGTFYAQGSTANALAEAGINIQSVQASQGGTFTLDYTTARLRSYCKPVGVGSQSGFPGCRDFLAYPRIFQCARYAEMYHCR